MMVIWLTIMLILPGQEPITLLDETRPSIEVCLTDAAKTLQMAAAVEGEFEYAATCAVRKDGDGDPA